jgi:hypothetical protein
MPLLTDVFSTEMIIDRQQAFLVDASWVKLRDVCGGVRQNTCSARSRCAFASDPSLSRRCSTASRRRLRASSKAATSTWCGGRKRGLLRSTTYMRSARIAAIAVEHRSLLFRFDMTTQLQLQVDARGLIVTSEHVILSVPHCRKWSCPTRSSTDLRTILGLRRQHPLPLTTLPQRLPPHAWPGRAWTAEPRRRPRRTPA